MPKDYKLDRTAFKRQTAEEADDQLDYIMTRVKGLSFEEVFPKAELVELDEGLFVRLIALEDLLKAKRASGRAKDFDDIRHLNKG